MLDVGQRQVELEWVGVGAAELPAVRTERRVGRPTLPLHDACMGFSPSSQFFDPFCRDEKWATIYEFEGSLSAAHGARAATLYSVGSFEPEP